MPRTTLFLACCLLLGLSGCKLATIRPLDPATGKAIVGEGEQGFDAKGYASDNWESPLLETIDQQGTELTLLLAALKKDSEAASEKYGRHEGNSPYSFMVKGEGKVLELDTSSRAGLLTVDLAPYDGKADAALAVGPVITGTALRDAMPFIKFNDFTNQLEFADVSKALHEKVMSDVIEGFDAEASVGKTIRFWGAMTLDDPLVITPVRIEVQ